MMLDGHRDLSLAIGCDWCHADTQLFKVEQMMLCPDCMYDALTGFLAEDVKLINGMKQSLLKALESACKFEKENIRLQDQLKLLEGRYTKLLYNLEEYNKSMEKLKNREDFGSRAKNCLAIWKKRGKIKLEILWTTRPKAVG